MDRRKFIQTGIAGVAGLSLVRTGLANIQMTVPSDISVDRVKLGKTGLKVSRIAMGTGTKGWNYQSNQTRLGLDNFVKIARHGYERGIRFFDMADMYGSQPFVGKALKELPREKLTLMTKMWTYDERVGKTRVGQQNPRPFPPGSWYGLFRYPPTALYDERRLGGNS